MVWSKRFDFFFITHKLAKRFLKSYLITWKLQKIFLGCQYFHWALATWQPMSWLTVGRNGRIALFTSKVSRLFFSRFWNIPKTIVRTKQFIGFVRQSILSLDNYFLPIITADFEMDNDIIIKCEVVGSTEDPDVNSPVIDKEVKMKCQIFFKFDGKVAWQDLWL
jgi:hypothetical protein